MSLSFLGLPFGIRLFSGVLALVAVVVIVFELLFAVEIFVRGTVNGLIGSGSAVDDDDGFIDVTLPKVLCTKFVGFLNIFVKLLVLNDSRPLDVVFDSTPLAESALIRVDFVLGLNIILTL